MLRELHIKDFAIIDELTVVLEPGLNILTGETGAGKSILIDAVALLLGDRADTTALRQGTERARIEGMFILSPSEQESVAPLLTREGLEGDTPDILWLARELRASGKTIARVNGRAVSLALLREIAEGLVDIHGQSEHLSLLREREHLNLLDRYAGLSDLRLQVSELVNRLQDIRRELRDLRQNERDRMQRIDLLRFQVQEIRAAKPAPGEIEELEAELVRLSNAEQLASLTSNLITILEDGQEEVPSVLDLVGQSQRELSSLARIDASFDPHLENLEAVSYQIEDLARALRAYFDQIEFNPQRLTLVEERLVLLRRLERKYGGTLEEVRAYAKRASEELHALEHSDERIESLEVEESELLEACATLCVELSKKRQEAAQTLSSYVEQELNDLHMEGARLGVAFRWPAADRGLPLALPVPTERIVTHQGTEMQAETMTTRVAFDATGMDQVEFLVAPNVGEGLKPMTRIASGGETARLMLAIKTVLARADHTPTLIFDEIDQGIGGRVGGVVGDKLWRLSAGENGVERVQHQVLCITHLPQLAGFGDAHFKVAKHITAEGRTVTHVTRLDESERIAELAQMLGTQGEAAQEGAQQILAQAAASKNAR